MRRRCSVRDSRSDLRTRPDEKQETDATHTRRSRIQRSQPVSVTDTAAVNT